MGIHSSNSARNRPNAAESCGRRHWVEGKARKTCPACAGELTETVERRQRCQAGYPTRRVAQTALTTVLCQLESGAYCERKDVTLSEFLREEWLPTTQSDLTPFFGPLPMIVREPVPG